MAEYGVPSTRPSYGSCGVSAWSGDAFPTKKSFLEWVRSGAAFKIRILSLGGERTVFLNAEDAFGKMDNEPGVFYVCGPVAEVNRKWYAEVSVMADGKIKVS